MALTFADRARRETDFGYDRQIGDAERAARLGGTFTVESPAQGGTRLSWSVPL
ncbi:hypothetical protein ACIBHX_06970 [Nonomuraea sp. NPDC050536]|uniref:hypothetical protein n=1 Tax=Nonomuraea sp. NPDC050536 TaxID=3364366 RepID=UPI0037C61A98